MPLNSVPPADAARRQRRNRERARAHLWSPIGITKRGPAGNVDVALAFDIFGKTAARLAIGCRGAVAFVGYVKPEIGRKLQRRFVADKIVAASSLRVRISCFSNLTACLTMVTGTALEFLGEDEPRDALSGEPASGNPAHRDYLAVEEHRSAKRRLAKHPYQLAIGLSPPPARISP